MAYYDGPEDDLYQRHSQRRFAQEDDYYDRVPWDTEGFERGDMRGDMTGDMRGGMSGGMTGDMTGGMRGGMSGGMRGDMTGDMTGGMSGDMTGGMSGGIRGDMTGDMTGGMSGGIRGDMTGGMSGGIRGDMTGDMTGGMRDNMRGDMRPPRDWRDPGLDDWSHNMRDRSWDAGNWDAERDDRRGQEYDQMYRDRRARDERYRGRTDRDFDEPIRDPMEQDLMPYDDRDWGERHHHEMNLNALPVREGRGHAFIAEEDVLEVQHKRSMGADRHEGLPWTPEREPVDRSPTDDWNELKSDVPTKTVMLSGLSRAARPADVYHLLHGFHHKIQDMQIDTTRRGDHAGIAFIDFFTQEHAADWMDKIQGSLEVLNCTMKADYSSLVLKSEQSAYYWQRWVTTDPTNTLVFWNIPTSLGSKVEQNQMQDQIKALGYKPLKVIIMRGKKTGEFLGYGFIEFLSVADAVAYMDFTKGVIDMSGATMLAVYSSGGKKDEKYTAAEPRPKTDKGQMDNQRSRGATVEDQKDCTVYVASLMPEATHQTIMEVFQLAGEVQKIKKEGNSATVRFTTAEEAKQAASMLNGMIMFDNKIAVNLDRNEKQTDTVKAPVIKTDMDLYLIRTKNFLYDPSTDKFYKKNILKKCPVAACSMKKAVDWKSLARHWIEIHTPTKKKFTCPIKDCNRNLTHTELQFRTHLQSEHNMKGHNLDKQMKGAKFYLIQNEKFSDPGNVVLPSPTQVKIPQIRIPKTPCQVEGCPHSYTTMSNMQQHWANYHRPTLKMYTCSLCKGVVKGKSLIQDHLYRMHRVDFNDSKAKLVEWKNHQFIDPGHVIPFWSLYTEEDGMNHHEVEKELGKDFPLVDIPLEELEKEDPNLYDFHEWTENYMHRLEVARKYALTDLQELACKALDED